MGWLDAYLLSPPQSTSPSRPSPAGLECAPVCPVCTNTKIASWSSFLLVTEAGLRPLVSGRISALPIHRTRVGKIDRFSVYFGKECGCASRCRSRVSNILFGLVVSQRKLLGQRQESPGSREYRGRTSSEAVALRQVGGANGTSATNLSLVPGKQVEGIIPLDGA
jgi:hypothetical protein